MFSFKLNSINPEQLGISPFKLNQIAVIRYQSQTINSSPTNRIFAVDFSSPTGISNSLIINNIEGLSLESKNTIYGNGINNIYNGSDEPQVWQINYNHFWNTNSTTLATGISRVILQNTLNVINPDFYAFSTNANSSVQQQTILSFNSSTVITVPPKNWISILFDLLDTNDTTFSASGTAEVQIIRLM